MKETIHKFSRENLSRYSRIALAATAITLAAYSGNKDSTQSQTLIPQGEENSPPIAEYFVPEPTGYGIEDLAPPLHEKSEDPAEIPITQTPTPIQSPEPNRENCQMIRGTAYLSDLERDFYLKNCVKEEKPIVTPRIEQQELLQSGAPLAGQFTISGYYCQRVVGYPGYDNGGYCGSGASGRGLISGQTAACGPNWSFGTVFYIEGYGAVTCTDRGGAVGNNHLDIYFGTDQQLHNTPFPRRANVHVAR